MERGKGRKAPGDEAWCDRDFTGRETGRETIRLCRRDERGAALGCLQRQAGCRDERGSLPAGCDCGGGPRAQSCGGGCYIQKNESGRGRKRGEGAGGTAKEGHGCTC